MPAWPRRERICLECRTLLPAGTPCPASARHTVVPMSGSGRESLLAAVWGHKSLRQHLRSATRTGATGGATGGLFNGCSVCDGCAGVGGLDEIIVAILVFAVACFLLYFVFVGIRALVRYARRPRLRPRGAAADGATVGPPTGRTGEIRARATAPSPLTGTLCAGYGLELTASAGWFRRTVLLRDGASVGFDVVLDDGGVVTIPPGPLIVDLTGTQTIDTVAWIDDYRDAVDPDRARADDLDPFPADCARHRVLRSGDRVEVRGPLRALPGAGGYRDAPAAQLEPTGVPRIAPAP
jgi:hypothetical protein